MSLQFEIDMVGDPGALADTWRELESRADPSFFQSWNWIGCWFEQVGAPAALLTGRSEGRIVLLGLLLPSTRRDTTLWSTHGLRLHTTGEEDQDVITIEYNGFLVDRDWTGIAEPEAIGFLAGGLTVAGRRRDELHLRGVTAAYERFVPGRLMSEVLSRKPSWRIDLDAVRASGKPYLDHLSANTRQQIRRSLRLYEKRGKLAATRARTVEEGRQFLDGLKDLHQRYWNGRGEPGGFAYPFFTRFLHRLTERCLVQGGVELVRVSCGAEAIGYVYNFLYRGHVYAYQTGLLYEDDPKLKPGLVSHYLCIDRHVQEGARIYDFMAGEARYKSNLGEPGPEMVYILVERPTLTLKLEHALRNIKRRLEPARRRPAPPHPHPHPRPAEESSGASAV